MFPRPDSPPPRQPSPDLVHTPLTTPPRRRTASSNTPVHLSSQRLMASRSCDGLGHKKPPVLNGGRQLMHSRSCDNIRLEDYQKAPMARPSTASIPNRARTRHISFLPLQPFPSSMGLPPPVPPLPSYLRHQDDSDSESSWDSHRRLPSIRTLSSHDSLRRKCRSPPPPPKRASMLAPLKRIKLFSFGGASRCPSPLGSSLNM